MNACCLVSSLSSGGRGRRRRGCGRGLCWESGCSGDASAHGKVDLESIDLAHLAATMSLEVNGSGGKSDDVTGESSDVWQV